MSLTVRQTAHYQKAASHHSYSPPLTNSDLSALFFIAKFTFDATPAGLINTVLLEHKPMVYTMCWRSATFTGNHGRLLERHVPSGDFLFEFANKHEALELRLNLNGLMIDGKPLTVKRSTSLIGGRRDLDMYSPRTGINIGNFEAHETVTAKEYCLAHEIPIDCLFNFRKGKGKIR